MTANQGAPPSTGSSLCGVLANLAMHEAFRGSFADSYTPGTTGGGGNEQITPVKVLVLVAGDTKVRNLTVTIDGVVFVSRDSAAAIAYAACGRSTFTLRLSLNMLRRPRQS